MARAIDLSTVSPDRAAKLLKGREAKKREYERKRDVLLARNAGWREANPEKAKACGEAWREANPERKAATTRAYYDRNREAVIARQGERDRNLCDARIRADFVAHTPLHSWEIPQEMVSAIRHTRLIRRELRKIKKCTTTN